MATLRNPKPLLPYLFLRRITTVSSVTAASSTAAAEPFSPLPSPSSRLATKSALRCTSDPDRIFDLLLSSPLPLHSAALHRAIRRLACSRRPDLVNRLLSPSLPTADDASLTRLIVLYSSASMLDQAVAAFHLIANPTEKALCALMAAFLDNRLPSKARECFHRRDVQVPRTIASCNLLLKALCDEGDVAAAEALLMGGMVAEIGVEPEAASFNVILSFHLKSWDVPNFEKFETELVKRGLRMDLATYNHRITVRCRKNGDIQCAEELFDEMIQRGVRPNVETYKALIGGFCRVGDLEKAKKWFGRLRDGELAPSGAMYSMLVRAMVVEGKLGEAVDLCRESLGKGWAPPLEAATKLVEGLVADLERVEEAKDMVEMMRGCLKGEALVSWIKFESTLPF